MTVSRFTLLLGLVVVASMASKTAAREQRVRTLPHQRVPIESRLEPDDQIVEIDYWADVMHPDNGVETREEIVARMTRQTNLIATVRISQVTPFLVEDGLNRPGFIGEPIMREDGSDAPTQQVFSRAP